MPAVARSFFVEVARVVRRVPRGRIVTYGQVARMAGRPGAARMVGWALHSLPEGSRVPWHRVINARGAISSRGVPLAEEIQRQLLLREGIGFSDKGRIDLERYRWNGGAARRGKKKPGTAGRRPRASSRRVD
jgi:methylated-DNA-protein-cysteine methyltransferase-like protein